MLALLVLVLLQVNIELCKGRVVSTIENPTHEIANQHSFRDLLVDLSQFYRNTEDHFEHEGMENEVQEKHAFKDAEFGLKYEITKDKNNHEEIRRMQKDSDKIKISTKNRQYYQEDMPQKANVHRTGMIRKKFDYDSGNYILGKWVDPHDFTNLELKKIMNEDNDNINIPIQIQYKQFLPKVVSKKRKSTNRLIEAQEKKSLYNWFQKIKESGRFKI